MTIDPERNAEKTRPPDEFGFPSPAGPVMWAEVYRGPDRLGVVWMAVGALDRPRAGILVRGAGTFDIDWQRDLGRVTLELRFDSAVTAADFLAHLAETRTGVGGTLRVTDARQADSLDAVRARLNKPR